ncbi:Spore photoproduct lyase [Syntrophomonas zehnderi OL-4]|uniref:Spore photoproduct lyase n=1 Tax=Syntrophomonas zehnderi OL-4 TaxID=690567 RepID=A0A0E4C8B2_9FIRM|nr:spore photoproduct lyase [Syntrophomonas zehnderi]CFX39061.1 Spore photoproduct lyase [Syntrophomonas zehnderi OL-4]
MPFVPQRVFFESGSLDYPMAQRILQWFKAHPGVNINMLKPRQRIPHSPGASPKDAYRASKQTLVVGIRKTLNFQSCKPSAHYQLPLVTGCMGQCEYCYLNTQFGKNPYLRVYVNLEEILNQAFSYIESRKPDLTVFEGAATSDPLPVEPYTHSLADTIQFLARQEHSRFRFVTKYDDVDSLLNIDHQGHTMIRFSINADHIIQNYEHFTPPLQKRLQAAAKVVKSGYPLGFIIGPVILFDGWESQYQAMFNELKEHLSRHSNDSIRFEIISHRFTSRAKNTIMDVYPASSLPMDESQRKYKYGQFGYGKYVYPPEQMTSIQNYFSQAVPAFFPEAKIDYII